MKIYKVPFLEVKGIILYTNKQIVIMLKDKLSDEESKIVIDELRKLIKNDRSKIYSL